MSPYRCQCCQRQSIPANLIPDERSAISIIILKEDFRFRKDAYLTFLLKVNNSITRKAIGHFQVDIENAIKYMDHVYYYCSRFVDFSELESIPDNDTVLMIAFETYILHYYNHNVYSYCFKSLNFCHDC